jgi:hypothetical protein
LSFKPFPRPLPLRIREGEQEWFDALPLRIREGEQERFNSLPLLFKGRAGVGLRKLKIKRCRIPILSIM